MDGGIHTQGQNYHRRALLKLNGGDLRKHEDPAGSRELAGSSLLFRRRDKEQPQESGLLRLNRKESNLTTERVVTTA
jgi:hypothetical protein